jgi:hypothetical protein
MSDGLLSYEDLVKRWQVQGESAGAKNRAVRRICTRIGLRPLPGFGRGGRARFRPASVESCEAKQDPLERSRLR